MGYRFLGGLIDAQAISAAKGPLPTQNTRLTRRGDVKNRPPLENWLGRPRCIKYTNTKAQWLSQKLDIDEI